MDTSQIVSAWRGLEPFAHWLVQTVDPKLTVELGVDYGFSLIELARYSRGRTDGIDWFQGDNQAGFRDVEKQACANVAASGIKEICIYKGPFDSMLELYQPGEIDILHIDGAHDYASVEYDFYAWLPKVCTGGIILLHDTRSFPNDVGRFFQSITFPKFEIEHSHGLGVVTKV